MGYFSQQNQGHRSFLVYTTSQEDVIDSVALGMFENNRIAGLLSPVYSVVDATASFQYNITSKLPLNLYFTGPVGRVKLLKVMRSIAGALAEAEEYLIPAEQMQLQLDRVYADVSSGAVELVCLPLRNLQAEGGIGNFFRELFNGVQHDVREGGEYLAVLSNYLNQHRELPLQDFVSLLDSLLEKQPEGSLRQPAYMPGSMGSLHGNTGGTGRGRMVKPVSAPVAPPAAPPPTPAEEKKSGGFMNSLFGKDSRKKPAEKEVEKKADKKAEKKQDRKADKKEKKGITTSFAVPGAEDPFSEPVPEVVPRRNTSAPAAVRAATPAAAPAAAPRAAAPAPAAAPAHEAAPRQSFVPSAGISFGATTYLDGAYTGGTTVIETQAQTNIFNPRLRREANGETVPLNKPMIKIGRNPDYADYCLNVREVSGSHAYIEVKDGFCTVVDTNSVNHTYLNGQLLVSGQAYPLEHGDTLTFAKENFLYTTHEGR